MATISITKERMVTDINGYLCGLVERVSYSGEYRFDSSKPYRLCSNWAYPGMGDLIQKSDNGKIMLGVPGIVCLHGYHYHDKPVCHPWLQEQEDKYPGFIEKVWLNMKGI